VARANRLLFLLPFAPRLDGTHGGSKAIAQVLLRLAIRHKLAAVYLRGADEPPLDDRLRERLDLVKEVARPWGGMSLSGQCIRKARMLVSLIRHRPTWVTHCTSSAYATSIESLAKTWQPDVIHVEYHVMGQYLPALRDCNAARLLVEHEPGNRASSRIGSPRSIIRLVNYFDSNAWRQYEPAVIRQVQAVVVFTENDRQAIQSLVPGTPVVRIPIGTELPATPMDPLGSLPRNLLFFGNFIHPPNVDAALRTVRTIFPQLQTRFPDLELYIVGDNPPAELKRMANPQIHITGCVADLALYLERASIIIAPLRAGGGMRLKVLEALGAGKAVVASPRALEGLNAVERQNVYVAESDEEFCHAIAELLLSPEKRVRLANEAWEWACANLSWDKSIAAYEALHAQLIANRTARSTPGQEASLMRHVPAESSPSDAT
jgi:polysaccharide biosynthesis protein PslH